MTLSTTTSRVSYPGAGSTGPFAFPFRVQSSADLLVTKRTPAGTETILLLATNYTVTGIGEASGTITLVTALAVGESLFIRRKPALTQATSITNQGTYYPKTHEDEFDLLTMQLQSLQDSIDRCAKLKETVVGGGSFTELEPTAGKAIVGTGTGFTMATLDAGAIALPGESRTVATLTAYLANNAVYNVKDYGALGSGTVVGGVITGADDLAAFVACLAAAKTGKGAIYIPPLAPAFFYRLSGTWLFSSCTNISVFGAGVRSLLVIHNAAAANCITLDASINAYINGIGISGVIGSGHGIAITNDSHMALVANVTAAWLGKNAFHVSGGIDARFDHCDAWQDMGYDPAVLGGLRGNTEIGFCVTTNASGHTNNAQCIGCQSEACKLYGLKVGDSTDVVVIGSFTWLGGLIEGTQSPYKEVYLRCTDGKLHPSHVESQVAVSRSEYSVTLDRCTNTHVSETVVTGDILLTGCVLSGVSKMRTAGVVIDQTCVDCYATDGIVGVDTVGPSTGKLVDLGLNTKIERVITANVPTGGYGYRPNAKVVAVTSGRSWNGTQPEGWQVIGGPTLSQVVDGSGNATIRLQITAAGFGQFIRKVIGPIEMIRGKWITIDARILVVDKTKPLIIFGSYDGGAATSSFASFTDTNPERVCAAFYVAPTRTLFSLDLSGINGADIKISEIQIAVSDFAPTNIDALGAGATPDLIGNGYMLPTYTDPGSATAITGFGNAERGRPFTILFTAARTLTNSATLILAGAANFVAKNGDTMTLVYDGANAKFREVARMVS